MLAVIRIRGRVGVEKGIENTLRMLRLERVNNCVILQETPSIMGMVEKVKDFVAYGEIDFNTLLEIFKERGRLGEKERLTEDNVKETGFESIAELTKAVFEGRVKIKDVARLNPVFRLRPPSKGHKSIKEHYPKGSLGYWGNKINELLRRMI